MKWTHCHNFDEYKVKHSALVYIFWHFSCTNYRSTLIIENDAVLESSSALQWTQDMQCSTKQTVIFIIKDHIENTKLHASSPYRIMWLRAVCHGKWRKRKMLIHEHLYTQLHVCVRPLENERFLLKLSKCLSSTHAFLLFLYQSYSFLYLQSFIKYQQIFPAMSRDKVFICLQAKSLCEAFGICIRSS